TDHRTLLQFQLEEEAVVSLPGIRQELLKWNHFNVGLEVLVVPVIPGSIGRRTHVAVSHHLLKLRSSVADHVSEKTCALLDRDNAPILVRYFTSANLLDVPDYLVDRVLCFVVIIPHWALKLHYDD